MLPVAAAISAPADIGVGSILHTPQAITGAWEMRIASGKVVGFDIGILADAEGAPKIIAGTTQRIAHIWITVYERSFGRSQRDEWSTDQPAQFSWIGDHLTLSAPRTFGSEHPIALDLSLDRRKSTWSGTLQDESFSGPVVLKRPWVEHIGYHIIGDWLWGSFPTGDYNCKHVALGADSALVIWSDAPPPASSPEWYGMLDMDQELRSVNGQMMFFTGTDMSGDVLFGNVLRDGNTFSGKSGHFGNGITPVDGAFTPFSWTRTTPDCKV